MPLRYARFSNGTRRVPTPLKSLFHASPPPLNRATHLSLRAHAAEPTIPAETPDAAKQRHERVAERRKGTDDHLPPRGVRARPREHAGGVPRHASTWAATATRSTSAPPRTACWSVFHDDMLDRLLEAYGDVSDYTWDELQRFRFRDPGPVRRAVPHPDAGRGLRPAPQARRADAPRHQAARARRGDRRPAHEHGHVGPRRVTATPTPAA